MKPKNPNLTTIKIKRAFLFLFGLIFFLFPSNNWYSIVQATYQPPKIQPIELELPRVADYPVNFTEIPAPSLTAKSIIVVDRDSAVVMFAKDERVQLLPASTVKLMTALVVLDYYDLESTLTVIGINNQGQDMRLKGGEVMTVKSLLFGVLVASANDAATLLAQNYPGGEKGFVEAMNEKAKELNLNDTYFVNPTGLDIDEKGNLLVGYSYSTALDLARLASLVIKEPLLGEMVATPKIVVTNTTGQFEHVLYNINELLSWLPGMKGVKTGWTEEAGECLVGYVERDGRGIITVILGSQDRFGETARLVDWAFSNYRWENIAPTISPSN
ncbi:MAG TPA: hypothetical protein VMY36_01910 [Patescibacteria group bacterium]|nr:hypothetical protein [Patescibacteria group bacterium]